MAEPDRMTDDSKRLTDEQAAEWKKDVSTVAGFMAAHDPDRPEDVSLEAWARVWEHRIKTHHSWHLGDILRAVSEADQCRGYGEMWMEVVDKLCPDPRSERTVGYRCLRLAATNPKAVIRAVAAAIEEDKKT